MSDAGLMNGLLAISVALMSAATPAAVAQANEAADLSVELASGTPLERQGRDQLQRLVRGYDIHPWMFTRRIRIESGVIPHSHPVLTLNTAIPRHLSRVSDPWTSLGPFNPDAHEANARGWRIRRGRDE